MRKEKEGEKEKTNYTNLQLYSLQKVSLLSLAVLSTIRNSFSIRKSKNFLDGFSQKLDIEFALTRKKKFQRFIFKVPKNLVCFLFFFFLL